MVYLNKNELVILSNIINEALHGIPINSTGWASERFESTVFKKISEYNLSQNLKSYFNKEEVDFIKKCFMPVIAYLDADDFETRLGGTEEQVEILKKKSTFFVAYVMITTKIIGGYGLAKSARGKIWPF